MVKDYYKVLGLSEVAFPVAIQSSFQELIFKLHPRMSKDSDTEKYLELFEAFEILSNIEYRDSYDNLRNRNVKLQESGLLDNLLDEKDLEGIEDWRSTSVKKANYYAKLNYSELMDSQLLSKPKGSGGMLVKFVGISLVLIGSPILVFFFNISVVEIIILIAGVTFYYSFMKWVFTD